MDGKRLEYKGEEALKEIERLTEKADEVQKKILKEILTRNRETEYLSKYMKGSKDILDFKLNVPVITYMGIRPFIQRIANGEDSSLISGHPITEMLSRSLSLSLCLSLCEVCFWVFYIYIYIFFFLLCLFLS
jgi:auxin responsive GH3 family protein